MTVQQFRWVAAAVGLAWGASSAPAQFAKSASLHVGTGWLPEQSADEARAGIRASEWNTTVTAEIRIGPGITVGPLLRYTRTFGSLLLVSDVREGYWGYGVHVGYARDVGHGITASLGATFTASDFCACGNDMGFRRPDTRYIGGLARLSYAFTPVLSAELGVTFQSNVSDVDETWGHNFATVGLALEVPGYNRRLETVEGD